ncbi:MAG: TRAP transporter permease DctM/Q [Lautropia sp.]|nr:MAG: TRAP transporter large permease subunit [Pseudomonadota bacterium]MBC6958126.1 TRAP transporter permease DctM/Q [Lautropia sp.]MBW7939097.1 TRAP transporter large permease subunit [Candidatus Omnitrophota bacterium]MCL4700631.1 TRAP transporter large permease subunit [Burkholderiaceae bacterium]MCZ2414721.1 TRAP transporter large permease subunit [Burkholderiales bacterium]MDL1906049.1 TRAP transporter large permease subunit [Betaproteobacteria bacterium PRO1]
MSLELITILYFVCLFATLAMGLPVAFGLGGTAVLFAAIFAPEALLAIPSTFYSTPGSTILVTIPMFLFMGNLIRWSGVADAAYEAVYRIAGHIAGGLAMGTVMVCTIFAAITGITPPATITMGQIAYPSMIKYRYSRKIAIGCIAAGGALGALIPPSVPFIFYGLLANASIGKLFLAGVTPGIMLAAFYILYIAIRAKIQPEIGPPLPAELRFSRKEKLRSVLDIWPFVVLIVVVLGSIWGGVATPAESACMGAVGALLINVVQRRMTWEIFRKSMGSTITLTGMGFWILICANVFTNIFSALGAQDILTEAVLGMPGGTVGVLVMMMLIVLILGTVMDDWAIIMLCTPLFLPILDELGVDKVWFGALFIINIQVAYLSPPFGFVLFWIKSVLPRDVDMGQIYNSVWPFIGLQLLGLLLVFLFPQIALWLPDLVG